MISIADTPDTAVTEIAKHLKPFEAAHRDALIHVYRYNTASIRVRIVDECFRNRDKGERHDYAFGFLESLPNEVTSQLSLLLCLAPGETSLLNVDFESPSPSLF